MRLARWRDTDDEEWLGTVEGDEVVAFAHAADAGDGLLLRVARERAAPSAQADPVPLEAVRLRAPLTRPPAIRDFYAFEAHVAAARAGRGLEMDPDWYELPVFYFSNPHTVIGPGDEVGHPHTDELDYELEVAAVIGEDAANLTEDEAVEAIAGYTVMNDWSARDLQRREMRLGLGPAKGKDFATALGPFLVTPDELGGTADRPRASMVARVNGEERSRGELADLHHPFPRLVAHASRDARLRAGDVIGSGTVGTGCILEFRAAGGRDRYPYLSPGDVVELEVQGIGVLRNVVGPRPA